MCSLISVVYYTRTPNDVLFEELIYVLLVLVEEMNFHIWIGDGIQTDSLGNTRKSDGLVHKVNILIFVIVVVVMYYTPAHFCKK